MSIHAVLDRKDLVGHIRFQHAITELFASGVDAGCIDGAMTYFLVKRGRIARLPVDVLSCIATHLNGLRSVPSDDLPAAVDHLIELMAPDPGYRPLSAASKLYWCTFPDRGVIYDRLARDSLARLERLRPSELTSYARFVAIHDKHFQSRLDEARETCQALPPAIRSLSWAPRKVFDQWLLIGAP